MLVVAHGTEMHTLPYVTCTVHSRAPRDLRTVTHALLGASPLKLN